MALANRKRQPLALAQVRIADGFWRPRLDVNRTASIPHIYAMLKKTGRLDALRLAWKPGDENPPHIFWDSDTAKWLEAASHSLAACPDAALEKHVDAVIDLLAKAQQPDGYLNVHFTVVEPDRRWTNLRDWHELYCAGHLIEAAVAHFETTGKRTGPFPHNVRAEIYRHFIHEVRRWDTDALLYVCTETRDMWDELKDELGQDPRCYVCGCGSVAVPGKRLALSPGFRYSTYHPTPL